MLPKKLLILTVPHGASHERAAAALKKGLLALQPELSIDVVDALEFCPRWFRFYYNSYEAPLRYCPRVWDWIESFQHNHSSTGPAWLYRRAGTSLVRLIENLAPDTVIATEVGMCEIVTLLKRERGLRFNLIGLITGVDADRAWAQPEVDLYLVSTSDLAQRLIEAGASAARILACGQPVDPAFTASSRRVAIRGQLGIREGVPLLLILFGGSGIGAPERVIAGLRKVKRPFQAALIAGRNRSMHRRIERLISREPNLAVHGWVNNMHEWMAAADLVISKPGASTLLEALACGLPFLAIDPLPGNERRACDWIEESQVGRWIRKPSDLAAAVDELLDDRAKLANFRDHALALGRPCAAREAARAILSLQPLANYRDALASADACGREPEPFLAPPKLV